MDRRTFLKHTAALGAGFLMAGMAGGCSRQASTSSPKWTYTVPEWTGDSFMPMHHIRDGSGPKATPQPSRTVDVVVIGAGLSGLTAAYQLREHNILVLEREDSVGGNAKQGDYEGITYSKGSAYLVDVEEPYGPLYDTLGLTLNPVASPTDVAHLKGQWHPLESGELAAPFERLKAHMSQLLASPDFPSVPIEQTSAASLKLDTLSFYDYLKNDTAADLLQVIDAYCFSALGGSIREISAFAGINFYSEIAGDIYAFPGGNGAVAERLTQAIEKAGSNRIQTAVSVFNIEQQDETVLTTFFNNHQPDHVETIASKAVILAVPYFFASRILKGLSSEQAHTLRMMQYGAYLVANCCFDKPVYQGGYDNWAPNSPHFTDFVDAGYVSGQDNPNASVLTVYAPFRNALHGRAALLQGNKKALARQVAESLHQSIGFPRQHLKEIRLTRYGHQLLTSKVGLFGTLRELDKNVGRVTLAHSDGQGMAAIESAVTEGLAAAERVKPQLLTRGIPLLTGIG